MKCDSLYYLKQDLSVYKGRQGGGEEREKVLIICSNKNLDVAYLPY